jgi:hypothetical protein
MNPVVWAEMQSMDTLQAVEHMVPDLVSEEEYLWRYTLDRYRQLKESLAPREEYGKEKVVVGISLVAHGASQLLLPGNAMAAAAIQLSFQLGFSYIGSFFGPQGALIGFGIGTIVGGVVAAIVVYGIPLVEIAVGIYLIGSGIYEMASG